MFDSFPYEQWSDAVTDFWTWGGHNSTGTYVLTALGVVLAVSALIGWVRLEKRRLEQHAAQLHAARTYDRPPATTGGSDG